MEWEVGDVLFFSLLAILCCCFTYKLVRLLLALIKNALLVLECVVLAAIFCGVKLYLPPDLLQSAWEAGAAKLSDAATDLASADLSWFDVERLRVPVERLLRLFRA